MITDAFQIVIFQLAVLGFTAGSSFAVGLWAGFTVSTVLNDLFTFERSKQRLDHAKEKGSLPPG